MKKIFTGIVIAVLSLTVIPAQSEVVPGAIPTSTTNPAEAAAAKVLINRLSEIDALDKSTLKASEKRELRKEVRTIKRELNRTGGVYLSVGALLLVIILLIVLL